MKLTCGPLTLFYQDGFVRYIQHGSDEVLRMIYFALRDENWGTVDLSIVNETIEEHQDGFAIRCEALNRRDEKVLITWQISIDVKRNGSLVFSINGNVLEDFKKNRAGFCVLHPLKEVIGEPVVLSHPDGTKSEHAFPTLIVPATPFKEVTGMRWRINAKWYNLKFEGDIFETEDQRNWGDASFKTFCTPQRLPFPAPLRKGDQISQRIEFHCENSEPSPVIDNMITISKGSSILRLPEIGIGSSPSEEFTEKIFALLKEIKFDHYRIDVDLSNPEWPDIFSSDVLAGQRLESPFEIALHLPSDPRDETDKFINLLRRERIPVRKVTLLSKNELTTKDLHILFIPLLREMIPGAEFGIGTDFNFTELNRYRMNKADADYVTFAVDPQEHATDDLTVIENAEAPYWGVASAFDLYELPVHVSPVLLKRKYNPYATDPAAFIIPEEERFDARQQKQFCALWTLGSVKSLVNAKAAGATYFQAVGVHGILSAEGEPYPVYDVFKLLSDKRRFGYFYETTSTAPLHVEALWAEDGPVIVWNYTDQTQEVLIEPLKKTVILSPHAFEVIEFTT